MTLMRRVFIIHRPKPFQSFPRFFSLSTARDPPIDASDLQRTAEEFYLSELIDRLRTESYPLARVDPLGLSS